MTIEQTFKKLSTTKKNWTNSCKFIVLHHTAFGWDSDGHGVARALSGDTSQGGFSVHYVVGKDGTVWKIGEDTDRLWHAWDSEINFQWIKYWNANSIGIEIDNRADKWEDTNGIEQYTPYPEVQIKATNELVLYLMNKHNIKVDNIWRHADLTKRKWDVSPAFFTNQGLKDLQAYKDYILTLQIMNDYKKIFEEQFPEGSQIFKDLDGAARDLTNPQQIAYFIAIGFERTIKLLQK